MLKPKSISKNELSKVESLLRSSKLCFNDINENGVFLYAVEKSGETVGYYGYELYGTDALFRSMVVTDENRGKGLGSEILQLAISELKAENVKDVYLLTNTADHFFAKQGFENFNRQEVPESIANTSEFKEFCPQDSVCMHLTLN